ncbi:MAG: DUF3604 domain-containing protein [Planctomycetota bacterium]
MQGIIKALLSIGLVVQISSAGQSKSPAAYRNEEQALQAGEKLGIGSAVIEEPQKVEVYSFATVKLVYTAGKAGIKPDGSIRICMRHLPNCTPPQTKNPQNPGYLTVKAADGAPTIISVGYGWRKHFFRSGDYFPWQNIVQIKLPQGLTPNKTIRVTYGDQSSGSPGIRTQPFDETSFGFKVFIDALANGDYLPLRDCPSIEITPSTPHRLGIVMPSDAVVGQPTWCIVRAEDGYGNPTDKYLGTVKLSSTDQTARLPAAHTFTPKEKGIYRFDNIVFNSAGHHTITVRDNQDAALKNTGNPVRATDKAPELLLLWGDLHGHTLFSDGRGTVEEYYDFAERAAGLDFCAVSDHACEVLDWMWEHSKKVTNNVYKPGRFVTFQAYEWSGSGRVGGDHNVYFLDDDPPIYRSLMINSYKNLQIYNGPTPKIKHINNLFTELAKHLKNKNVFCIPHWGGRHGNPKWHNPKVQRMIEIFSEHRRSEDWATGFLKKRYRIGIMASTDSHYGNPGYGYLKPTPKTNSPDEVPPVDMIYNWKKQEIGMAAVAVFAKQRTRESIFQALYDRHVYATSGNRIILSVQADGHRMGSEYKTDKPPTLTINACGTDIITKIEIKKDSQIVHTVEPKIVNANLTWKDPNFDPQKECYYYARIVQANNEEAISSPIWVN